MPKVERRTTRSGAARWCVRFTDPNTGRQSSRTFTIEREATNFAASLTRHGAERVLADLAAEEKYKNAPTLDEWAERYFASATGITDGTRITYRRVYARAWSKSLGHLRLGELTRERIGLALNQVSGADKTVRNAWGVLASLVKAAVADGHMVRNPCQGIRLPRNSEHESIEHRYLTHEEFARLVAALPEYWRPLVITLAGTGMRWGELAALTVADFDAKAETIRITKAEKFDPSTATRTVGPTKTPKSRRTVRLPPEVIDVLVPLTVGRKRTDRLFLPPKGGPLRHRTFWSDIWRPACNRAGLEPPPRIHDMRHCAVAWLIAAGIPLPVIQARLGHTTIKTTSDVYGHLLPDLQRAAADAASVALRGVDLAQIEA